MRQRGHLLVATPPVLSHKYIEVLLTLVRKPLFGHLLSCSVFARVVYAQSICSSELAKTSFPADRLALFVKALEHVGEFGVYGLNGGRKEYEGKLWRAVNADYFMSEA